MIGTVSCIARASICCARSSLIGAGATLPFTLGAGAGCSTGVSSVGSLGFDLPNSREKKLMLVCRLWRSSRYTSNSTRAVAVGTKLERSSDSWERAQTGGGKYDLATAQEQRHTHPRQTAGEHVVKVLLVVDDSRTIRAAVELIFEGTEYRVVAKDTGAAGLAWVRSHTPDLILVDERMQDMDGYAFGAQVKANSKNEDVPILLLACQDGPDE